LTWNFTVHLSWDYEVNLGIKLTHAGDIAKP
jgi:hypothetical protein